MAEHSDFEIANAWEEVEVVSRYGDKAHYRINQITKQVLVATRLGDGNASPWRGCNVSYDAIKKQAHTVISAPNQDFVPAVVPVVAPEPVHNGHKPKKVEPLDIESAQPFAPKRKGHE